MHVVPSTLKKEPLFERHRFRRHALYYAPNVLHYLKMFERAKAANAHVNAKDFNVLMTKIQRALL